MLKLRYASVLLLSALLAMAPNCTGRAEPQSKQEATAFPREHQGFLDELSAIMKKHPKAAEQITLRDKVERTDKHTGVTRACCEYLCNWDHSDCSCVEQCQK